MRGPIVVTGAVRIPASAVSVRAVRASGPGGQNVNKVATKVELRVDLAAVEGLSEAARVRLRARTRHRLDADGRLVVTSQVTRSQARNLEDARARVADLVRDAMAAPGRRVRTAVPVRTDRQRLAAKQRRARLKRSRGRPGEGD